MLMKLFYCSFLFSLICSGVVFAQSPLEIDPLSTNQLRRSEGGLSLPTGPSDSSVQPVHILPDNSRDPEPEESQETAGAVQKTKAGFLLSTGIEYADEGEFEEAERAYLRSLNMDPDNEQTLMRLGSLYVQMKKFNDAVEMFSRLLEVNPENPLAHNNLAWCYAIGPEVRNVPLALRHSREALLFAPAFPSVWNTLAEAYYVSGQYDKALRSAEEALRLLQRSEAADEQTLRSFQAQLSKIRQAKDAAEMLMGGPGGDNG